MKTKLSFRPKTFTKRLLSGLKDRARDVVVRRYGLEDGQRATLQSIGETYGITRERVRQIENFAIKAIRKSDSFGEAREIFDELHGVINEMGGIVDEHTLLNHVAKDEVSQNHVHLYLVLGENFHAHKENSQFKKRWSVSKEMAHKVHDVMREIYDTISKDDLLEERELIKSMLTHDHVQALEDEHKSEDVMKQWLSFSKSLAKNPLGFWGRSSSPNVQPRGIRDLAYLVLRGHGSPLHFREIADEIAKTFDRPTHVATTHNEVIKDSRFVLIGRGVYGLREWGYEPGTAREVIQRILQKEGPLTKEEVINRVMKERYLKKNTILVNLQNPKYFTKNNKGEYDIVESKKIPSLKK